MRTMMTSSDGLAALRQGIDEIDARLLALLLERAALVETIGASKGKSDVATYQPAREAQLLRNLLATPVAPVGADAVFGIWREIIAASVRIQGRFTVAILRAPEADAVRPALQHFGFNHTTAYFTTPSQVIDAVVDGAAAVGVLPHWKDEAVAGWWRHLVRNDSSAPRVVGRLPFLVRGEGSDMDHQAFVIAASDIARTGRFSMARSR